MANKNPRTRVMNIPAQFVPLLERELEETGCFSFTELMGKILKEHFDTDGLKEPAIDLKVIKGRKING